ncbi:thiol-disulfide oxidoreductase DCC family protein [Paenibacillus sp. 32O-W]|uniref:thiol-disulfide oxidoreductase DCC family protein n=1 Tax=Paenibacillus sp. 32O-W TaxID=1695218 RepID=UPI00119CFA44|nr:DUF393 domain-containing protein [Paenibacillus sp. 32O-W]
MKNGQRLILLYDAHCVLCRRTVDTLSRLEVGSELIMLPYQEAEISQLPEGLTLEQLQSQLHVIDEQNEVYRGAEAVCRIMSKVKGWRWIAVLYRIPFLRPLADRIYKWIADNRYKLFGRNEDCESGSCQLHLPMDKKEEPESGKR